MAVRLTRAGVALTVGIIVVTGLIIGGLFWVKHAGEQARYDEATKIAQQKLEDESSKDVALNSGDDEKNTETKAENGTNNGAESGASQQTGGNATGEQQATELPQTGPAEDSLTTLVVVGVLAFATVSYWRSRRVLLEA